jgi:hypothetical protein
MEVNRLDGQGPSDVIRIINGRVFVGISGGFVRAKQLAQQHKLLQIGCGFIQISKFIPDQLGQFDPLGLREGMVLDVSGGCEDYSLVP